MIERVTEDVAVMEGGADDLEEIALLGQAAVCRLPDRFLRVVGDGRLVAALDDDALRRIS
jgi:hypothetical protein